jgi:hypothetical protein
MTHTSNWPLACFNNSILLENNHVY